MYSTRESISSNMAFVSKNSLRILWTSVAALIFLTRSSAAPTFGGTDKAMMYLAQYGYLSPSVKNPSSGHIMDESSWRRAIAEFQSFAGLNTTDETIHVMALPRYDVRYKVGCGENRRKRYVVQGSKWRAKNLTYKISKYPSRLNGTEVDAELAKAFSVWANYTDLTFTQKRNGRVHIEIRFEKGEHGDGDPFDGPGGIYAHAYFPMFRGDTHFDDDEEWSINSKRGINLFQVAAHEFGHALGLEHGNVSSGLMSPYYYKYDPAFQLDQDSIKGIQAIYGHKSQIDIGGGFPKTPKSLALQLKSRHQKRYTLGDTQKDTDNN
ncbi:stromelysin-3-like [Pieris napi]|uniref:stromelysin-3-like n=1 Tax=Pieris napi TaxID=78633 RepID=UPI001FB94C27|nr:stromelysin-3-like [Pieris napi]